MKNKIYIIFALFLGTFLFNIGISQAESDIGIYIDETEHTVVFPYEKSFRVVARIVNHISDTRIVRAEPQGEMPNGGHLLIPIGEYRLEPGQEAHMVAVFEVGPADNSNNSEIRIPIRFKWEGGEETFEFTIENKNLPFRDKKDELSNVEFIILDKYSNEEIKDATITALLPSGMEQVQAIYNNEKYELDIPSNEYLERIKSEYKIDLENTGYFLQISKAGYKNYLKSNFLPKKGEDKRTLALEPLDKVGNYKLEETVKSGYSVWWIKSSANGNYIAASQGAHGQEGIEPPSYSKVLLLSEEGKKIWENEVGGECWGLDISFDGNYIASGCHDGKIYVWNRSGKKLWEYANENGNQVRWVKFSPDSKYLLSGPVNNRPEESGIFNVATGELKWSYYTGDYLREGVFSSDGKTTYFDSANGIIHALNTETGKLKWSGNGDHYIPFMFYLSESTKQIYTTGKGLAFTALESDTGKFRWQTSVDQTITAANTASDGSIVGVTVGGMIYKLNKIGEIEWARHYGGVGHNGVHYTDNGQYILLGGPNTTLLDGDGNVLWQRDSEKEIEMTGPAEQWTGGSNDVWMNEDASLLVLGGDDGDIEFYKGKVIDGENNLRSNNNENNLDRGKEIKLPPTPFLLALGILVVFLTVIILIIVKMRKK
jgi:WD40 repeat protein